MEFGPQPWRFLQWTRDEVRNVKRRGKPTAAEFVLPKVYCRDGLPLADATIGNCHEPRGIDLNYHENCSLLPRNVVLRRGEEHTVMPPTFLRGRMKQHGALTRTSPDDDSYSLRDNQLLPSIKLDEEVYYVETDHPKVFGHVLVEALPMLWGYGYVPKGTKVATSIKLNRSYLKLFNALGVSQDSIISIDRPVTPRAVYFPALPFVRRTWVHPVSWLIFDQIKQLRRESAIAAPKRIYVSRSQVEERPLVNELEVEMLFESLGFVIVHPQNYPIEDQVALFAGAELVAGTGGSAMHNMVFCKDETRILIIASDAWLHVADILIAQEKGHLGYVFGKAFNVPKHTHKSNSPWAVNLAEIKEAVLEHFGLDAGVKFVKRLLTEKS